MTESEKITVVTVLIVVIVVTLFGICGGCGPCASDSSEAPLGPQRPITVPAAPAEDPELGIAAAKTEISWVQMEAKDVHTVVTIRDFTPIALGQAVILQTPGILHKDSRVLLVFIDDSGAMAIAARLARQRAPRPMTHDLFEDILARVGGKVKKAHIEDFREGLFLGRLYIQAGNRTHDLDVNPADAIALALNANAPIYVSQKVLDREGTSFAELTPMFFNEDEGKQIPSKGDSI